MNTLQYLFTLVTRIKYSFCGSISIFGPFSFTWFADAQEGKAKSLFTPAHPKPTCISLWLQASEPELLDLPRKCTFKETHNWQSPPTISPISLTPKDPFCLRSKLHIMLKCYARCLQKCTHILMRSISYILEYIKAGLWSMGQIQGLSIIPPPHKWMLSPILQDSIHFVLPISPELPSS